MPPLDFASVKTSVEALFPEFAERAEESEKARRMPADLAERLKATGWYRSGAPKRVGGADASIAERARILEKAAEYDASAAWTMMIGLDTPSLLCCLSAGVFERMYAEKPNMVLGGGLAALGKAEKVEGGYRVTGRWPWGSGCLHSDYMSGGCVVTKNGEPIPGLAPHLPLTYAMIVPVSQTRRLHDETWFVSGLSGTGSCDWTLDNVFVPDAMAYDIWNWNPNGPERSLVPLFTASGLKIAAVATGIAQGAVNDTIALAKSGKKRAAMSARSADQPVFQHRLAEAESRVHAARAITYDQIETLSSRTTEIPHGFAYLLHPLTKANAARSAYAVKLAVEAAHICCEIAGGSAVANNSLLQRRRRDIDVLRSHIAIGDPLVTRYGASLLGIEVPP